MPWGALRHNVAVTDPTTHTKLIAPSATPEHAAAIVAAIERFARATAPAPAAAESGEAVDGWRATAILEAVSRDPWAGDHHPWVDHPQPLP